MDSVPALREIYSIEERYRLVSRQSALIEEETNQETEGEMSPVREDPGKPVEDAAFGLSLEERPDVHVTWTGPVSAEVKTVP